MRLSAALSVTVMLERRPAVAAVSSVAMLLVILADVSAMVIFESVVAEPDFLRTASAAPAVFNASAASTPVIVRSKSPLSAASASASAVNCLAEIDSIGFDVCAGSAAILSAVIDLALTFACSASKFVLRFAAVSLTDMVSVADVLVDFSVSASIAVNPVTVRLKAVVIFLRSRTSGSVFLLSLGSPDKSALATEMVPFAVSDSVMPVILAAGVIAAIALRFVWMFAAVSLMTVFGTGV